MRFYMFIKQAGKSALGLVILPFGAAAAAAGCMTTGGIFGLTVPVHIIKTIFSSGKNKPGFWNASFKEKFVYLNNAGLKAASPFNILGGKLVESENIKKWNSKIDKTIGTAASIIGSGIGLGISCTVGLVAGLGVLGFATVFIMAATPPGSCHCCHSYYCTC